MTASRFLLLSTLLSSALAHSAFFHPSMWGFNVKSEDFPYDNRPVAPLFNRPFNEWWFHNHLSFPPAPGQTFPLPAGGAATAEIACNKGATSFFQGSEGGDIRQGNNPCPNSPTTAFHANNIDEVEGCALAIAYKSDVNAVQPEDFAVFSVNHLCVWTRFTEFRVPKRMPPCPEGGCVCAFFWVHSEKGGGQENYMNGFKCDVQGAEANAAVKVAQSRVARRCGSDPARGKPQADQGNCTAGAKTPFYWVQAERNNMFEDPQTPPVYNDLYGFSDGAQEDIFEDSYIASPLPIPSPGAPVPVLRTAFNNNERPAPPSSAIPSPSQSVPPLSSSPPASSAPAPSAPAPAPPVAVTITVTVSIPETSPSTDSSATPSPTFIPAKSCRAKIKGLPLANTQDGGDPPECAGALEKRDANVGEDGGLDVRKRRLDIGLFGRRRFYSVGRAAVW